MALDIYNSQNTAPYGFGQIQWLDNTRYWNLYQSNPEYFTIDPNQRYRGAVAGSQRAGLGYCDGINFDADGNLWITLPLANRIVVLTPAGRLVPPPRGVILDRDLSRVHEVDPKDPAGIQEFIDHSWYDYQGGQAGLHPWDGQTNLNRNIDFLRHRIGGGRHQRLGMFARFGLDRRLHPAERDEVLWRDDRQHHHAAARACRADLQQRTDRHGRCTDLRPRRGRRQRPRERRRRP